MPTNGSRPPGSRSSIVAQSQQPDGVFDVMNWTVVFWELATFVILVTAIVVVALVVRRLAASRPAADPARHIVDERYARGEIGREEYEQKRRDLRR